MKKKELEHKQNYAQELSEMSQEQLVSLIKAYRKHLKDIEKEIIAGLRKINLITEIILDWDNNKRIVGTKAYALRELGKFLHEIRHYPQNRRNKEDDLKLSKKSAELIDMLKKTGIPH